MKQLPRRRFLRGLGASVSLPYLSAMAPAFAKKSGADNPARLVFVYVPNGVIMENWTPAAEGPNFDLPPTLQPLAAHRERLLMLSGLTQNNGRALGDGPGDHARAAASYLTGVHPRKTAGADIKNGISADQVAALAVGHRTRLASIELGCEEGRRAGNCDSGYACAYSNNISWRSETTPMPPEVNPRLAFERLFGADAGESPEVRARRRLYRESILDLVQEDTRQLQSELGPTDRRKLEEYLTAVRDIEKRIEAAEANPDRVDPEMEKPAGVPIDYDEHAKLMFDILAVALEADITRIATLMLAREGSNLSYRQINVSEAHHGLTHHRGNEENIQKIGDINRHHMTLFARFIDRLANAPDGDFTVLDRSMIVYGSGISDGNRHTHHDLPILIAGKGNGFLKTNRHVVYPHETPLNNMFVSLLDRMDVHPESLGDSTGRLEGLSELS